MALCLYGTFPHVVDPQNPGAVDEVLNMGEYWYEDGFKKFRKNIIETNKQIQNTFKRAYKFINAAKLIHDDWSNYNKNALDYSRLALVEEDLKNKLLSDYDFTNMADERHLFATAFTPNGIVTFIDNLCEDCEKVYVLNGGPGTGKTEILNFMIKEATKRGFFTEVYHDPLIPERIEHIVIPELKTAVISSNEINNTKFNGTQIYLENLVNYSLIDKAELQNDKDTFYNLLNKALSIISSAKKLHDDLEVYYVENMIFKNMDKAYYDLIDKILKYEEDYKEEQG